MSTASFRFHDDLSQFLGKEFRGQTFVHACARAATLKNAIEALGVPHTEVGTLTVNGEPATLQRTVREGDRIEVFPWKRSGSNSGSDPMGSDPIFLADAHLGRLARFLRMLGFDTLHRNAFDDAEIRRLADEEGRIVLTRDRELLKCREIRRGCYVRELKPERQLAEWWRASAWRAPPGRSRCACIATCRSGRRTGARSSTASRRRVLSAYEAFSHCQGCDRVYWPGSHYQRMREALRLYL